MTGENDATAGGKGFGKLRSSLRHLGVDKTKYQAKLIDYKQSQRFLMGAIVNTAKELQKNLELEFAETKKISGLIGPFLEATGAHAQRFTHLADTIRTGESEAKNYKEQLKQDGSTKVKQSLMTIHKNMAYEVNKFKDDNNTLKQQGDKIVKTVKKDEEDLKRVLVLIELLRLLIQYYYEVDSEIKRFRLKEVVFSKNERRDIEHETNEAVANAGQEGTVDNTLKKEGAAGDGTGFE